MAVCEVLLCYLPMKWKYLEWNSIFYAIIGRFYGTALEIGLMHSATIVSGNLEQENGCENCNFEDVIIESPGDC